MRKWLAGVSTAALLVAFTVALLLPASAWAPRSCGGCGKVLGKVTDASTGEGIAGALVEVSTSPGPPTVVASDRTNPGGHYKISSLEVGTYLVNVETSERAGGVGELVLTRLDIVHIDCRLALLGSGERSVCSIKQPPPDRD